MPGSNSNLSSASRVHVVSQPIAVEMKQISKRFGAVQANDQVNLQVPYGSIHGLVGENGAGKSTLMSILYGMYSADSGEIKLYSQLTKIRQTQDAIAAGIGMVHQHFMLVGTMTALENIMLGAESSWLFDKAQASARKKLEQLMQSTGLYVELDALVDQLSVGNCQRLEILKTLFRGAKILILDEPTAVLTPQETISLFEVLKKLRSQGTTIMIITHKLKEVMALCDNVTVMRGGKVVHESAIANTSTEKLAQAMVGRAVHMGAQDHVAPTQTLQLAAELKNISLKDHRGVLKLNQINLKLFAGEIVGVAGVSGNGQSELLDVLSGMQIPQQGQLQIADHQFEGKNWLNPTLARQIRIGHIPEDRHGRAMVLDFAAWESGVLGFEDKNSKNGWMDHGQMKTHVQELMHQYDVRPPHIHLKCGQFSGGNQQKQVIARELSEQPSILLIGQPTRGVDIGAIEFIHQQIRKARDAGCAVLLVSSELDEVLALADRVIVMNQGSIAGELAIKDCNEINIGLLMAGDTRKAETVQ